MTPLDRFIALWIEPFCHAENAARRVFHWVAEKAIDRHVTKLSRLVGEEGDDD